MAQFLFDYATENNLTLEQIVNDQDMYKIAAGVTLNKLNTLTNIALDDNHSINRNSAHYKIKQMVINRVVNTLAQKSAP